MTDHDIARHLLETGGLTPGQYDAWKLANINQLSIRVIASGTGRSKTTVADLIDRAQQKIDRHRREAA